MFGKRTLSGITKKPRPLLQAGVFNHITLNALRRFATGRSAFCRRLFPSRATDRFFRGGFATNNFFRCFLRGCFLRCCFFRRGFLFHGLFLRRRTSNFFRRRFTRNFQFLLSNLAFRRRFADRLFRGLLFCSRAGRFFRCFSHFEKSPVGLAHRQLCPDTAQSVNNC